MKTGWKTYLLYLLSFLAVCAAFVGLIYYARQQDMRPDARPWTMAYQAEDPQESIAQYVLNSESLDNWKELFTVQKFYNTQMKELQPYFVSFVEVLKEKAPDLQIGSRIIEERPDSLLAEWWVHDGSPNAQHEWMKAVVYGNNFYVYRYTTKKIDEVERMRNERETFLKAQHPKS
jgi:hypothetical protein